MNTLQKGSSTQTTVLIIILLIVAALGLYVYAHRTPTQEVPVVSSTQPDTTTPDTSVPTTTPPAETPLPPHAGPDSVAKVYTDKAFGYTITYPKIQSTSVDKNGTVTFFTLGSGLPPVTAAKVTNSADTSTGKWGKNVLSYTNSGWVTQLQNDKDGSLYTAATNPFAYTPVGLPIFNGGTRHGFGSSVYVVALSHTKFLIISGPEGLTTAAGYDYSTDPTLQIAKAVTILN